MKVSQLRYHTVQCSKITVDNAKVNLQNVYNLKTQSQRQLKTKKAGAVILQLALKLQKGNNFPVIPIESGFTYDMIISFHQPGTGR